MDKSYLSRYLFGDFPTAFHTSLPVSAAVGRLAATSDQSTFHSGNPQLHGYATANEVVLWESSDIFTNPFRPYFHGSFSHEQGITVLSGVVRADWRAKVWCTVVAAASPIAMAIGDGLVPAFGLAAIGAAAFLMLHLSIRPGSRLVRSLETKIDTAITGDGANSSFKPNRFAGRLKT